MIKLALDGITSFSYKPLVLAGYLGGITFLIGVFSFVGVIIKNLLTNSNLLSLGLILTINLIMFGLIFCLIGIMGQYLGRIFDESKNRPLYIIESVINYKLSDRKMEILR
jgi:glycosyltransferase involved in cell wall biosynthesis